MKTVPHRLLLAYRGEDFFGWQRQDPDPTVQLALEKALQKIFNRPVAVAGSGRTDRGVHALGQVASCEIPPLHPPAQLWQKPSTSISLQGSESSPSDVRNRAFTPASLPKENPTYTESPTPILFTLSKSVGPGMSHAPSIYTSLRKAAKILTGKHDFAAFTSNPGYERKIHHSQYTLHSDRQKKERCFGANL